MRSYIRSLEDISIVKPYKFFRRDREEPNTEEYDDHDFFEVDESGIDSDGFDRIGNRPNRPNKDTPWKALTMTNNPYLGEP